MRRVDWCDAATLCAWAGKRLCQAVGSPDFDSATITAANSEWFYACSDGEFNVFHGVMIPSLSL